LFAWLTLLPERTALPVMPQRRAMILILNEKRARRAARGDE
jgi:hypothetical protein